MFDEIPDFSPICCNSWSSGSQNPGPINRDQYPAKKEMQPIAPDFGILEPWEDNITNSNPSREQSTRLSVFFLCIFSYEEEAGRLGVDVGPAGKRSAAGAVIEIESRKGTGMDMGKN